MNECLFEVKGFDPSFYKTKLKQYDVVKIRFDESSSLDYGFVSINNISFTNTHKLIKHVLDELLTPSGKLLLRMEVQDLYNTKGVCLFTSTLRDLIKTDQLTFIAQCFYNTKGGFAAVKTMLIGISKNKEQEFKEKVRFISLPDKLTIDKSRKKPRLEFVGVPFSWQECISQPVYVEVENSAVDGLHPYEYVPLNEIKSHKQGIELGFFMELCINENIDIAQRGLDSSKFTLQNDFELFENYTQYVVETTEHFPNKKKPFYHRRIVNKNAIIFRSSRPIQSILFLNPREPIFINYPQTNDDEHRVAIQLKSEWEDKVDIEYIYLETRKAYFCNQFYYYNGAHHSGFKLMSSTILRARIEKPPSLDEQRLIVQKEKEKVFKQLTSVHELHKQLFNYQKEKLSLIKQLNEVNRSTNELNRKLIRSDQKLIVFFDYADIIVEQRRQEAKDILYLILPIKKCLENDLSFSTSGLGNKARTLLECIIQTLKSLHVVPSFLNVGNSLAFLCRKESNWGNDEIPEVLTNRLLSIKRPINELSHKEKKLSIDEALNIINTVISTLEWTHLFLSKNPNREINAIKWISNHEVKTRFGKLKRSGVVGVITNEWIDKRSGKCIGAWMQPVDPGASNIMIPKSMIKAQNLGYGTIVKVDAVKSDNKWQTTSLEVINQCPDFYQFIIED